VGLEYFNVVMRLIFRTVVGIVTGLMYGVLIGGSLLLISFLAGDPPVDLMLDYGEIWRSLTVLAMIITGSAGALVGAIVTLLMVGKIRAGTIGFSVGCVILVGIVFTIWPHLKNELSAIHSLIDGSFLLLMFLVLFILFPIGLAATGVSAVIVSGKFALR
jgi:hypothetical protein